MDDSLDIAESTLEEQTLREMELLNSIVLENSLDAFIAINNKGKIIRWNKQATEIFGWSENEVTGKSLDQFIVPRGKKTAYRKGIKRVLETGESRLLNKRIEINAQHREGHTFPVELTIMPAYSGDEIISFSAFIREISAIKKLEAIHLAELIVLEMIAAGRSQKIILTALCKEFEKLTSAPAFASVLLVNEDGTHLKLGAAPSFSKKVQDALDGMAIVDCGGSCATAVYRRTSVFVSDVQTDPVWADFRELTKKHNIQACWSMPFYSGDGSVMGSFALTHSIIKEPTESDIRVLKVAANLASITVERLKSQTALETSEEKFSKALELSPDAVVITRFADGKIIEANDACIRLSGYQREELIGKTTLELNIYSADERDKVVSLLKKKGKYVNLESFLRRKNGKVLNTLSSAVVLEINGEPCIYAAIRDITERKHAEESLSNKNQTLKALNLCNYELLHAEDEKSLLDAICKIIVEIGGYQTAGVGFAEHDVDKTVRFVARHGDNNDYLAKAKVNWRDDNVRGRGPVGVAIRSGKPHIIQDMKTEPSFKPWRKAALESGYASAVAIPLTVEGMVLGVMVVYSSETNDFDNERLDLLVSLANNLAYGIQTLRIKHEEQMAKTALHESEQKYSKAIEISPDSIIITRLLDGMILDINKAATVTTGYSREELIGKTTVELGFYNKDDRRKLTNALQKNGSFTEYEIFMKRRDGKNRILLSSAVVMNIDGEDCIFLIAHDITERKQIELSLSESEHKLRSAFETSPDAIAITSLKDGVIMEVNQGFIQTAGFSKEELIGKSSIELGIWPDPEDRKKFVNALQSTGFVTGMNIKIRRKNGVVIPILISASVIYFGGESYIFSASRDISDMQESSDKLERANWLLELEKNALEKISSGLEPSIILKELIIAIEEQYTEIYCSVFLLVDEGQYLIPYASSRLSEEYEKEIGRLKIGPSVGSCGTAAYRKENVFVSNIAKDPLWKDYKNLASKYGLRACWSMPIASALGEVHGTIAIYYKEPKEADNEHVELMGHIRNIAEISLEQYKAKNDLIQSEERFRNAFDHAPSGMALIDIQGNILKVNEAVCQMLGYKESELLDKHFLSLTAPDAREESKLNYNNIISGEIKSVKTERRYVHKEGDIIDVVLSVSMVNDQNGKPNHLVAQLDDITLQKKAETRLQESENRFRALYDGTPAMFFTINKDNTIASANIFGSEKLGYSVNDLVQRSTMELVLAEDREHYRNLLDSCFLNRKSVHNWEIRKVKKNGTVIWSRESARVIDDIDGSQKLLIVSEDITEAHKLSQELSYQASHDALTGLVNRREFEIRLERLIHEGEGSGEDHALCYLDLDQFKVINDTCGHLAGDELLRQLAELFKSKVRKKDTLARLGGDEFGVLMQNCSLNQAQRVAQDLREMVEEFHFIWTDKRFSIGVSIGLVPIDDSGGVTVTDILSAADASCYAAKNAGRNRVHVYNPEDIDLAVHRGQMQWVSRINHALEEDRFRLYIQPIVSISEEDKDIKHYECLIRMIDENGKNILPGAFLPAAERYDLSTKIDRWVFESAYTWLATRPRKQKNLISCSINLSGHSLNSEGFLDFVVNKLDEGKVLPSNICFEITETVAISNLSNAIRFMEALKNKGCFFALDDFGSGVSSYGYLKNLPVDYLKIDGMFIRDMVDDPIDLEMVRSINEIGHVMGKMTIAEFVENKETLDCLKKLGVDYAQGYHMGKPRAIKVPVLKSSDREISKNKVNKKKRYARTRKTD